VEKLLKAFFQKKANCRDESAFFAFKRLLLRLTTTSTGLNSKSHFPKLLQLKKIIHTFEDFVYTML
jgi:hypothetical protein